LEVQSELRDDLGRPVPLEPPATRIVSLVPSLTELLFALGAGSRVIGVTRYCEEPKTAVAVLPKLGGTKNPDVERILALRPDLVVANAEENRAEHIEQMASAGLRVFVSYPRRVADLPPLLRALGKLVGGEERAIHLVDRLVEAESGVRIAQRRRVFVPIWRNPWMSLNADTFAHDLLRCCGGENVCAASSLRYPEVSLEEIARADPEVVLLPDEPYRFERKHLAELRVLAATAAWKRGAVYFVDGKALTWFGPRTASALRYFSVLLATTTPA